MKFAIILAFVFTGSYGLLAMDPPKQETLRFPENSSKEFIKDAILFDIEKNLVSSPLFFGTQHLGSPEVYTFLHTFYKAIDCPEKGKKETFLKELFVICLHEKDGGNQELNISNTNYQPLREAKIENNEGNIWIALTKIAAEVTDNLASNLGIREDKIAEEYRNLIAKASKRSWFPRTTSTRPIKLVNTQAKEPAKLEMNNEEGKKKKESKKKKDKKNK